MTQHQAPEVTSELMPCPFCGGEAASCGPIISGNQAPAVAVCMMEGCAAEITAATEAEAITAWNTRATQPLSLTVDEILAIARLRELLAKATKGPWKVYVPDDVSGVACVKHVTDEPDGSRRTDWPAVCNCNTLPNADNAALIVAAVNALPALLDRLQSLSLPVGDSETCVRCGGGNPSWSAPSPLWNAVMRGGSINGDALYHDMVCVKCFMLIAEEKGVAHGWRLMASDVSAELETVTPSGRVWDEQDWLWKDPAGTENAARLALPVDIDRSGLAQEVDDISYAGVGP